jgi:Holliday junction resolvase
MTTPEKKVKDKVVKILKELGAYYFYPVTGGFGRSGIPDIVCCLQGNFIGIECKAGNNEPTALQYKNLEEIQDAGGYAFIVNEDNIDSLERVLRLWGK